MNFTDEYISFSENAAKADPIKKVISDDAFAIGSVFQEFIKLLQSIGANMLRSSQ